ncbi:hypothetical protein ACQ1Q5_00155 [Ornithobacterium rhinotracheale]
MIAVFGYWFIHVLYERTKSFAIKQIGKAVWLFLILMIGEYILVKKFIPEIYSNIRFAMSAVPPLLMSFFLITKNTRDDLEWEFIEKMKKDYVRLEGEEKMKEEINIRFLKHTIWNVGELIHYQYHDYQKDFPENAIIYSIIGSILRQYGDTCKSQKGLFLPVSEIVKKNPSRFRGHEEIIEQVRDFKVPNLIDLVSMMQGKERDDCFLTCVNEVKSNVMLSPMPYDEEIQRNRQIRNQV